MFWRRRKSGNKKKRKKRKSRDVESMFDEKEIKKILGSVM